jgi:hypothetical protein
LLAGVTLRARCIRVLYSKVSNVSDAWGV